MAKLTEAIKKIPKGIAAKKVYLIDVPATREDALTLASMQGLASRLSDKQVIIKIGAYEKYLNYMAKDYGTAIEENIGGEAVTLKSLCELYKTEGIINEYILCKDDKMDPSWQVAISLAGVLGAVAVCETNEAMIKAAGYTCVLDARDKDDKWLRNSEYWQLLNRDVALEQRPAAAPTLLDMGVKCGAYVNYYRGKSQEEHNKIYEFLNSNSIVFGYNNALGEYDTVEALSKLNLCMVPSDHACNLSVLSGYELSEIKQNNPAPEEPKNENVHSVCLIMSDGDNMQWAVNNFYYKYWYGSDLRGDFKIGWGAPAMSVDLMPPMLKSFYGDKTDKDEFIMELSGLGYTFPARWDPEKRREMTAELAKYMARTDLKYAEILDDGGMTEEVMADFTAHDEIEGLFYIDYWRYAGLGGKMVWTNGKPCVSARHTIWADYPKNLGHAEIDEVAEAINNSSTNPKDEDAYTFIIVHAWSGLKDGKLVPGGDTMAGLKELIGKLNDNVEVVTPTEFMTRIKKNLGK